MTFPWRPTPIIIMNMWKTKNGMHINNQWFATIILRMYDTSICNRNFFISLSKASLSLSNFSRLPHSSVFSNCNLSICQ